MDKIIITTFENITKEDKEKLEKAGYLVIVCADPSKVQFLHPVKVNTEFVTAEDIADAALSAVNDSTYSSVKQDFIHYLNKRLKKQKPTA